MGKKVPCKKCGKLLGVRDVIKVARVGDIKGVLLECRCGTKTEKQYNMK